MKRQSISLEQISERGNLSLALCKAAKGKRYRPEVRRLLQNVDENLSLLGGDIRKGMLPYGRFRRFAINDPKPRIIHAACFEDRIFHHALMNIAGDQLEKSMSSHSYACRFNKGVHKAIKQVQNNLQRYPFYCKVDINAYFASISHPRLMQVLMTRYKGVDCRAQWQRVIDSHHSDSQYGLPIGSLTSQYLANYYLNGLDQKLSEWSLVKAHIRYMDDIIWWCDSQQQVRMILADVKEYLAKERDLVLKKTVQCQASVQGVSYCGFRVLKGAIRLSRRRKKRYQQRRQYWEAQYQQGFIDANQLQLAYSSVHAITEHTDSLAWRQLNLQKHPALDV